MQSLKCVECSVQVDVRCTKCVLLTCVMQCVYACMCGWVSGCAGVLCVAWYVCEYQEGLYTQ